MSYTPKEWKDLPSEDTPITAECLNDIENELYKLTRMTTWSVVFPSGVSGGGQIARYQNTCHMSFSLSRPTAMVTAIPYVIWNFPNGYKPALNINQMIIDTSFGSVTYVEYDTVTNSLFLNCNSDETGILKGTLVYLTADDMLST